MVFCFILENTRWGGPDTTWAMWTLKRERGRRTQSPSSSRFTNYILGAPRLVRVQFLIHPILALIRHFRTPLLPPPLPPFGLPSRRSLS